MQIQGVAAAARCPKEGPEVVHDCIFFVALVSENPAVRLDAVDETLAPAGRGLGMEEACTGIPFTEPLNSRPLPPHGTLDCSKAQPVHLEHASELNFVRGQLPTVHCLIESEN
jgi:hypothetical protein